MRRPGLNPGLRYGLSTIGQDTTLDHIASLAQCGNYPQCTSDITLFEVMHSLYLFSLCILSIYFSVYSLCLFSLSILSMYSLYLFSLCIISVYSLYLFSLCILSMDSLFPFSLFILSIHFYSLYVFSLFILSIHSLYVFSLSISILSIHSLSFFLCAYLLCTLSKSSKCQHSVVQFRIYVIQSLICEAISEARAP